MAPKKMGRPTDDPKGKHINVRLSESDLQRLEFCAKETGMTRATVIRKAIGDLYESLRKKE